jgi:hypothetical protein
MANKVKRATRRMLKGAIATAKRDASVKDLSKHQKRRAANRLGQKNFRALAAKTAAAKAAKPKKAEAGAEGGGEAAAS